MKRIKFTDPKLPNFKIDYDMQGPVAAGLAVKVNVSFETTTEEDFDDKIYIEVEGSDEPIVLPLEAKRPCPDVKIPLKAINFETISKGQTVRDTLWFENKGSLAGTVYLDEENPRDKIRISFDEYRKFEIQPGERKGIPVELKCEEKTIVLQRINVRVDGPPGARIPTQSVLIQAAVVEHDISIVFEEKGTNDHIELAFGMLYKGELSKICGNIFNNGPKDVSFTVKFDNRELGQAVDEDDIEGTSPFEQGREQVNRVLSCEPVSGVIRRYDKIPVTFICKTPVENKLTGFSDHVEKAKPLADDGTEMNNDTDYNKGDDQDPQPLRQTAIFKFSTPRSDSASTKASTTRESVQSSDFNKTMMVRMLAHAVSPDIKINRQVLNFGECPTNERRDFILSVTNRNEEKDLDFNFTKVSHFRIFPNKGVIQASGKHQFTVSFQPRNFGVFETTSELEILKGAYKFPIRLMGSSSLVGQKPQILHGPQAHKDDFKPQTFALKDEEMDRMPMKTKARKKQQEGGTFLEESTTLKMDSVLNVDNLDKVDEFIRLMEKKRSTNEDFKQTRLDRISKQKYQALASLNGGEPNTIASILGISELRDKNADADYNQKGTKDIDLLGIAGPKIGLPTQVDPLYVEKPIGKYEPMHQDGERVVQRGEKANREEGNKILKKVYPAEGKTGAELHDIKQELSGEQLQKIGTCPNKMDFGTVFVKSKSSKGFIVTNELRQYISVFIDIAKHPELKQSKNMRQVIPPGKEACFELIFCPLQPKSFRSQIHYFINDCHPFAFTMEAHPIPVRLEIGAKQNPMKFQFSEDNTNMYITEEIFLTNAGNADAEFKWGYKEGGLFKPDPAEGVVKKGSRISCFVTFTPQGSKAESETLALNVKDGKQTPETLQCIPYIPFEPKVVFKDGRGQLDFGDVPIGIPVVAGSGGAQDYVWLKNLTKNTVVYNIENTTDALEIFPRQDKISGGRDKGIEFRFLSNQQQEFDVEVPIQIRCGPVLNLRVHANVITPDVVIEQDEFNFGEVLYGDSLTLPFTLINNSNIEAILELDLRDFHEFQIRPRISDGVETEIMCPIMEEPEFNVNVEEAEGVSEVDADLDDEDEENEEDRLDYVTIKLKPQNSPMTFDFTYKPDNLDEPTEFNVPIKMKGAGEVPGLIRAVKAIGVLSKLIIIGDPNKEEASREVAFGRTTISKGSKQLATHKDFNIRNPDFNQPAVWSVDTSVLDEQNVFKIIPTQGTLDPNATCTVRATFNPIVDEEYKLKVPVYLNNDRSNPVTSIELTGLGAKAKITFDRREIILPPVPLGITSRVTFTIYNQGYENQRIDPQISHDVGKLPLIASCEAEGRTVSVTKKSLKIEVQFTPKKPLSFTTFLYFNDDDGERFQIPISGTSDNSLFTISNYLQTNEDEIKMAPYEPGKAITFIEDAGSDLDQSSKVGGIAHKTQSRRSGSVMTVKIAQLFGHELMKEEEIDRSKKYIQKWFEATFQQTFAQFPNDLINDMTPILDLIQYLSGKRPKVTPVVKGQSGSKDVNLVLSQYEELITGLKENGAHLNTVRPEYLLSIDEYKKFLKLKPKEVSSKLSNQRNLDNFFSYVSNDSWIMLFYQILRIYYLNRITPKSFKNIPGMPSGGDDTKIDNWMKESNVYSMSECILLKWMTYHYNKMNPTHTVPLITNFDEDLKNGKVFAALIESHYGPVKELGGLISNPTNDAQRKNNAKMIKNALTEIKVETHIEWEYIFDPRPREMVLFCAQLYQALPHYIPKADIIFPATLGDLVTKNIELSNPSNNTILYKVELEPAGSMDFYKDEGYDEVRIPPKEKIDFPIKFQSRISAPVHGRLIFTNQKDGGGNVQAAAMVFRLISNVHSRNSIAEIKAETKLYQTKLIDLEVGNPFNTQVVYKIEIIIEKPQAPAKKGDKNQKPADKKKKPKDEKTNLAYVPDAFYCKNETVTVRKGAQAQVQIAFAPAELRNHKCHVVFTDPNVGELQYTIYGSVSLPEIPDHPQVETCNVDELCQIEIPISFKNTALEKVRNDYMQRAITAAKKESSTPPQPYQHPQQVWYDIELSHPMFTSTSNGVMLFNDQKPPPGSKQAQPTPKGQGGKGGQVAVPDDHMKNKVILNITPTKPAKYPCHMILKSQDRVDIRLFKIEVAAKPQKIKAQLEFRVPARSSVPQEIPIVNNSDKEWQVKAKLEPHDKKNGYFDLPKKELIVKKNSQDHFVLWFKPLWECQVESKLTLKNEITNEEYEYELKGYGEEPLAEDHIILNCKARETSSHVFKIENKGDKTMHYRVETDLQRAVGPVEFNVKPKDTYNYKLDVTPVLGGTYTASITFLDDEGRFLWWTVEVRTESPKPQSTIAMRACVRKATTAQVKLANPLNDPIVFEVHYSGEGLIGDPTLQLDPHSESTYSLVFSPLMAGNFSGTIGFLNRDVGEFWYELDLIAEENPVVQLDLLECELGRTESHFVQLENPTGAELMLDITISNPTHFEVIPDKVILPPYEQIRVCIQYSPSNLDVVESGTVVFENPAVGKWEFQVEGKGKVPTVMEPQPISTSVGNNTSSMLTFKNPFREQSTVNVSIETDDSRIFSLLLKRSKFTIQPLGMIQIPYSFSPQTMTESKATIVIQMSKQLVWRYPLKGIAESASTQVDYHFKTRARKAVDELISIQLPGFEELMPDDEFRYEINVQNPQHRGFIERSVFFEQENDKLQSAFDPLKFQMRFEPLRPFKTNTEFIIYKSTGGRWKFNMVFEALDPEHDDSILIQSPLHKTSSVSFKLTNHMRTFAEFQAFFTPDSAPEFVVYPKSGLLEPYGKEGSTFIVSFTPTEYGKAKVGKLVIQTEEMQWTYEIKGSHPQYRIPEVEGGNLNNKLSRHMLETMKKKKSEKKNFLKENLKMRPGQTHQHSRMEGSPTRGGSQAVGLNVSARGGSKSRVGGKDHSNERSTFVGK